MIPVLAPTDWYCPSCGFTGQLPPGAKQPAWHICPKLRMLSTPLLPVGTAGKHELREREDYVAGERVQLDPERGRPVMSLVTTRDEGTDAVVFAPTATGSVNVMKEIKGVKRD